MCQSTPKRSFQTIFCQIDWPLMTKPTSYQPNSKDTIGLYCKLYRQKFHQTINSLIGNHNKLIDASYQHFTRSMISKIPFVSTLNLVMKVSHKLSIQKNQFLSRKSTYNLTLSQKSSCIMTMNLICKELLFLIKIIKFSLRVALISIKFNIVKKN